MFSGIVETTGKIVKLDKKSLPYKIAIKSKLPTSKIKLGDSIAVEGVCLTVVKKLKDVLTFNAVAETLRCTTLGALSVGSKVNLERSLVLGDRLHGHFVFGHVDATARLRSRVQEGKGSEKLTFVIPSNLKKYLVKKGSISLSGVSLTVGTVGEDTFSVHLVPHTLEVTTLAKLQIGNSANLEIDMLARYVHSADQTPSPKYI